MFNLGEKLRALIFLFALSCPAYAVTANTSEDLRYDLKWGGIKAGTATLNLTNENGAAKIVSTAKSAKWLSIFYEVDDRIESALENDFYPAHYKIKLREGRHRRDKEVIFDRRKGKARYIDHLKPEEEEFDVPAEVFDSLSSFYQLRTMRLEIGKSVYLTVFDNKKVWDVEVQVLRREKVYTPVGSFNTIVVKPLLKSEGIFSRKGEIYIWLTDDEKRIPVKLNSKVKIGSITAELVGERYGAGLD